jgi:arsenate reductase
MGGDKVEAHSAGLLRTGVNPRAMAVMAEIGIDISSHSSKEIDPELLASMDVVVTVCDNAAESCPYVPPATKKIVKKIHAPVRDPVNFVGTEEEIMADFRRAREEIRQMIKKVLKEEL